MLNKTFIDALHTQCAVTPYRPTTSDYETACYMSMFITRKTIGWDRAVLVLLWLSLIINKLIEYTQDLMLN